MADRPITGLVYGVILNDRVSLELYGARMQQPPHGKAPAAPVLYIKPYNTHVGHGATVALPAGADHVEIGATLGIVFGATCSRATEAAAFDAVAGYTVVIDLSLPKADLYRPPIAEKCFDNACPIGPTVERSLVPDPENLEIRILVNGEQRHARSTSGLVRAIPRLIADISDFMSFFAGDVLLIGYPLDVPTAGPGAAIAAEIDGVGRLECRLALEPAGASDR